VLAERTIREWPFVPVLMIGGQASGRRVKPLETRFSRGFCGMARWWEALAHSCYSKKMAKELVSYPSSSGGGLPGRHDSKESRRSFYFLAENFPPRDLSVKKAAGISHPITSRSHVESREDFLAAHNSRRQSLRGNGEVYRDPGFGFDRLT